MRKWIVMLAGLLCCAVSGHAVVSWPYTFYLGDTAETVTIQHWYGAALRTSRVATNVAQLTDTFQLESGQLNQLVYLIKWKGVDSVSGWVYYHDLKTSYSNPETWTIKGVSWPDASDSSWLMFLQDGVQVGSTRRDISTKQSRDTTLYAVAGKLNEAKYVIFYPNQPPASWTFAWDIRDTSTTTGGAVVIPNMCQVTGQIFRTGGTPLVGAYVQAIPGLGTNMTGTDGTNRYILTNRIVGCQTDTTGRYSMYLLGTHTYADTTQGMYTLIGTYAGMEIFRIPSLWVPSSGVLNLADSLAARNK